jgi:hypothetical protein
MSSEVRRSVILYIYTHTNTLERLEGTFCLCLQGRWFVCPENGVTTFARNVGIPR